ncbi:NDUCR dehydrogenase, partial [Rhinoptilus africanus]|nr:NDUCR dehydrogenase [Rhinoptilus africanus]
MGFLPDESRALPPPPLLNKGSAWLGLSGWGVGLRQGDIPPSPAGVHRQVLFTTVGWFVGYYLTKRTEYVHAKLDRELFEYVRQHPEDFKAAG